MELLIVTNKWSFTCPGMLQPSCYQRIALQAWNHLCLGNGTFLSEGHLQRRSNVRIQAKMI